MVFRIIINSDFLDDTYSDHLTHISKSKTAPTKNFCKFTHIFWMESYQPRQLRQIGHFIDQSNQFLEPRSNMRNMAMEKGDVRYELPIISFWSDQHGDFP